jgi:hypothetical protein
MTLRGYIWQRLIDNLKNGVAGTTIEWMVILHMLNNFGRVHQSF